MIFDLDFLGMDKVTTYPCRRRLIGSSILIGMLLSRLPVVGLSSLLMGSRQ
jgi:hypothetical protein